MGPTLISFLSLLVCSCIVVFIVDRALRPSLRAMLDTLIEMPAATTFYVRAFSTTFFLAVLARVFGATCNLKSDSRFMDYVW